MGLAIHVRHDGFPTLLLRASNNYSGEPGAILATHRADGTLRRGCRRRRDGELELPRAARPYTETYSRARSSADSHRCPTGTPAGSPRRIGGVSAPLSFDGLAGGGRLARRMLGTCHPPEEVWSCGPRCSEWGVLISCRGLRSLGYGFGLAELCFGNATARSRGCASAIDERTRASGAGFLPGFAPTPPSRSGPGALHLALCGPVCDGGDWAPACLWTAVT